MKTTLFLTLAALCSCSPLATAGRDMNAANRALASAQKAYQRGEIDRATLGAAARRHSAATAEFARIGAPNRHKCFPVYAGSVTINSHVFISSR